jgi:hypothetical protein
LRSGRVCRTTGNRDWRPALLTHWPRPARPRTSSRVSSLLAFGPTRNCGRSLGPRSLPVRAFRAPIPISGMLCFSKSMLDHLKYDVFRPDARVRSEDPSEVAKLPQAPCCSRQAEGAMLEPFRLWLIGRPGMALLSGGSFWVIPHQRPRFRCPTWGDREDVL